MFERFTQAARTAVVLAQQEAHGAGADHLGAEHLLVGVLGDTAGAPAAVLGRWGVDAASASAAALAAHDLDDEALSTLGIDLEQVRQRAEAAFGPGALDRPAGRWRRGRRSGQGHIPFTDEAKRSLEGALRAAVAGRDREITTAHLLLGLLAAEPGTAQRVLSRAGVTASSDELARLVRAELDQAA